MEGYRLSKELRRKVCIHEAAHAVVSALGRIGVYRVAVAPEGATNWTTTGRKGAIHTDLWGLCSTSDCTIAFAMRWEEENWSIELNRPRLKQMRELSDPDWSRTFKKRFRAEYYRDIRAFLCHTLAGLPPETSRGSGTSRYGAKARETSTSPTH